MCCRISSLLWFGALAKGTFSERNETKLSELTALRVTLGAGDSATMGDTSGDCNGRDCPIGCLCIGGYQCDCSGWGAVLQHMHEKEEANEIQDVHGNEQPRETKLSEPTAKAVGVNMYWEALSSMHGMYWWDYLEDMHEKEQERETKLSELTAKMVNVNMYWEALTSMHGLWWEAALEDMHEKEQAHLSDDATLNVHAGGSASLEGTVKYLEFFKDKESMIQAMDHLAEVNNATVHYTDRKVFGKNIANFPFEQTVPGELILATCHDPADCETNDDSVCDSRFSAKPSFAKPADWNPQPALMDGPDNRIQPLCHTPPTNTRMVYALTLFEDGSSDWLMWACHNMDGAYICHVTDMIVVKEATLESIRLGASVV